MGARARDRVIDRYLGIESLLRFGGLIERLYALKSAAVAPPP